MATSSSPASSSPANSRPSSFHTGADHDLSEDGTSASVPVETLVELLLGAKRSLSSMTLVLRANQLSTHGRQLHEESVVLSAQTAFLRRGIGDQTRILLRLKRGMVHVYDKGKREFKHIIKTLDAANGKLESTMEMLRNTVVDPVFRPQGEEPRNLLDFVDEKSVDGMRNALKDSIGELQAAQTSFDGDLLRYDTDLRTLEKILNSSQPPSSTDPTAYQPIPQLLAALTNHSHEMAENLASLTSHFDLCVTAVRITEGGAAMARRKAAESTQSQDGADPVSISGVIAEQESNGLDLETMTSQERADTVQIVLQDAAQVDDVVRELVAVLQQMECDFAALKEQTDQIQATYMATTQAFRILEDIGSRLQSYMAAETDYVDRWENEKQIIFDQLADMDSLREFYEGYASAYDSLILEVERRKLVEEKIHGIWRKAKDTVDKLVETDWRDRDRFRTEVGDFIPTDLWVGMSGPLKRWEVVRAQEPGPDSALEPPRQEENSTAALEKSVVDAAKKRLAP